MVTVETAEGTLGGVEQDGLVVFRGVPYAAPPVGSLRLRPPQPPVSWTGTRVAAEFGSWAPQQDSALYTVFGGGEVPKAEDCLTLNIWTPAADGGKRPVMVWIHGGAFVSGSGSLVLYWGDDLARRGDVVVVTINYRLGALGFAAHPDLRDDETGACGNWGLLDQVAALRWVQQNIGGFGGDPENVTVFGESAGAMSVSTLLGMPCASGLFHKAIAQSGGPVGVPLDAGARVTEAVMDELGLSNAAELRDVPVDKLLAAQELVGSRTTIGGGLPFVPVIDGAVVPHSPLKGVRTGVSAAVPVLAGTNREEMTFFALGDREAFALGADGLLLRARSLFGDQAGPAAVDVYTRARLEQGLPAEPKDVWFAMQSDHVFRVPCTRLLEAQAAHQPNTYSYLFTWPSPAVGGILGSTHALELAFVFGRLHLPGSDTFAGTGPEAFQLSAQMQEAWLAFARTGDPGAGDLDPWPPYSPSRATMVLDADCRVEHAPMETERAFWDDRV